MKTLSMVVTDLDGTLLDPSGKISHLDMSTLQKLGEKKIVRVIATGRTPYSFDKVIPSDFPIDYLVFSSGAGTMEWKTKRLLYTTQINPIDVQNITKKLIQRNVDFMVHEPIPANHRFLYFSSGRVNPDFERRIELYKGFCQPFIPGVPYDSPATQILAVLPFDVDLFDSLKSEFPSLKVIRATSPLDGHSIWMEIFSTEVSKAYGIDCISKLHNIPNQQIIAIGNDFNDLDMLTHIERSYVVENSPFELKNIFKSVNSNSSSGFSHAVELGIGDR
jgi:Cof subfamily protein (haloacid dehalogenase superfamily)